MATQHSKRLSYRISENYPIRWMVEVVAHLLWAKTFSYFLFPVGQLLVAFQNIDSIPSIFKRRNLNTEIFQHSHKSVK